MAQDKFLLEIGIEEIPAQYVRKMADSLEEKMKQLLQENTVDFSGLQVFYTPRRLILFVESVALTVEGTTQEIKGPAEKNAYDEQGKPTKALEGFLAGRHLNIADTFLKNINGTDYIFATQKSEAKNTSDILERLLPSLIMSIYQPNPMRWNVFSGKFIRPIRWLLAFLGNRQLNFELEFVSSANITKGHRTLADAEIEISSVDDYFDKIKRAFVVINQEERRNMILTQIRRLEQEHDIEIPTDEALLDEIVNLVEYPTVACGYFSEDFLTLPAPIIITPMKDHQRYFPVYSHGKLVNKFAFVRNGGDYYLENVINGNQRVLTARLKDGEFFYHEDIRSTLQEKAQKLSGVVFQTKLGSYVDKMERVAILADKLSYLLKLDLKAQLKIVLPILKADLVSSVVGEFSEIQGIMGGIYARHDGYAEEIAAAIEEQYLPRFSGDVLPKTLLGAVVSVADKLDSIMGLFAVNLRPSGSQDPFALRRQTIGILMVMRALGFAIPLASLIKAVAPAYQRFYAAENISQQEFVESVLSFIRQRLFIMLDEECGYAVTDVLNRIDLSDLNIVEEEQKAAALASLRDTVAFQDFYKTLQRMDKLIAGKKVAGAVDAEMIQNENERRVWEAYLQVKEPAANALAQKKYEEFVNMLTPCCKLINEFFDSTLVLSEVAAERENRIKLLSAISELFHGFVL